MDYLFSLFNDLGVFACAAPSRRPSLGRAGSVWDLRGRGGGGGFVQGPRRHWRLVLLPGAQAQEALDPALPDAVPAVLGRSEWSREGLTVPLLVAFLFSQGVPVLHPQDDLRVCGPDHRGTSSPFLPSPQLRAARRPTEVGAGARGGRPRLAGRWSPAAPKPRSTSRRRQFGEESRLATFVVAFGAGELLDHVA